MKIFRRILSCGLVILLCASPLALVTNASELSVEGTNSGVPEGVVLSCRELDVIEENHISLEETHERITISI